MDNKIDFLRAIREAPDDDMLRLVFADWLDEQLDPQGEFIRVDCELAQLKMWQDPKRYSRLTKRRHDLLKKHEKKWTDDFSNPDAQFRRGLIEHLRGKPEHIAKISNRIVVHPEVRSLELVGNDKHFDALKDLNWSQFDDFTLNLKKAAADPIRKLADWDALHQLQMLDFRGAPGVRSWKLMKVSDFPDLQRLTLEHVNMEDIIPLLRRPLQELRMWDQLDDVRSEVLLSHTNAEQLKHLLLPNLEYCRIQTYKTLGTKFPNLETLSIGISNMKDAWLIRISKGTEFQNLSELTIRNHRGGNYVTLDDGIKAIATSPNFPQLEMLAIDQFITFEAMETMFNAPLLPNLKGLRLSRSRIDGAQLRKLGQSNLARQLNLIEFGTCPEIEKSDVDYFCEAAGWSEDSSKQLEFFGEFNDSRTQHFNF